MSEHEDRWWFCLRHMTVEHDERCPGKVRLGPYPTEADAARALDTVRQRNQAWDEAGGS